MTTLELELKSPVLIIVLENGFLRCISTLTMDKLTMAPSSTHQSSTASFTQTAILVSLIWPASFQWNFKTFMASFKAIFQLKGTLFVLPNVHRSRWSFYLWGQLSSTMKCSGISLVRFSTQTDQSSSAWFSASYAWL